MPMVDLLSGSIPVTLQPRFRAFHCAGLSYVPDMRYLFADCRWALDDPAAGRCAYEEGHIPGAVYLDVERDLSAPAGAGGRHPLPGGAEFARAAGLAGIGPDTFVVAYGTVGGAERLWWLLRHFGHDA